MPASHEHSPMSSPVRDLRNLRGNAAATAGEVRAFLNEMRGKSPKEMLGAVADSSLFQSAVVASIGAAILVAVLTIIPFVISKVGGSGSGDAPPVAAAPAAPDAGAPKPAPSDQPKPSTAEATPEKSAADALGIGDQKSAPAGVNPLENANDNLLDGLE